MVSKSKMKKKTNESTKRELLNLLKENDDVDEQEFNKTVNNVNNSQEAVVIIRCYEDIVKTQNKKIIVYIAKQAEILKKFQDTQDFLDNVGYIKTTIYFKILLYSLLKKYPLLKTYTLQLFAKKPTLLARPSLNNQNFEECIC